MSGGIRAELFRLQDGGYRAFQCRLLPTVDPETVIGVRTPELRRLAKRLPDPWTHRKAIESNRISPERKEYLRGLRIREEKSTGKGGQT